MKLGLLPLFKPESFGPNGFSATGLEYFSANALAEIAGFVQALFPQIQLILKLNLTEMLRAQPDLVLMWATSPCFGQVQPSTESIKAFLGAPVWLAGPHISYAPQTLPDNVDLAIIGEVELPLQQLLAIWLKQPDAGLMQYRRVPGIIYQSRGRIYSGQPAQIVPQLSQLPQPNYRIFLELPGFSAPIVRSARCSDNLIMALAYPPARKTRLQHPEHLAQQIEQIADNYAVTYSRLPLSPAQRQFISPVLIPDYHFVLHRQRLEALLPIYTARRLHERVFLIPNLNIEAITSDTLELLKAFNTRRVLIQLGPFGHRSPLLPAWTPESLEQALKLCKRYNLGVTGNLFLNPDTGTTRHQLAQTFLALRDMAAGFEQLQISTIGVFPGTQVWEQFVAKTKPDSATLASFPWGSLDWERFSESLPLFHSSLDRSSLREAHQAFKNLKVRPSPLLDPVKEEMFNRSRSRTVLEFLYKYWNPGEAIIEAPVWPETALKNIAPSMEIHQLTIRAGRLAGPPPVKKAGLIALVGTLAALRDPEAALHQLKGYLAPDGRMLIQILNPLSYAVLQNFFNWNTDWSFVGYPFLKFFKLEELQALVVRCGLELAGTDYTIMEDVENVRPEVEKLADRLEYHASLRIPQHMLYISEIKLLVRNRSL